MSLKDIGMERDAEIINKIYDTLTVSTRVDDDYVRKVFNIEINKIHIQVKEYLGDLEPTVENGMSLNRYLTEVKNCIAEFPKESFLESNAFGYDGGEDIQVFRYVSREETDKEFFQRLKVIAREIKAEMKLDEIARKRLGL